MTTYINDLRRNLETLTRCGISAEMCSILKDMLDHDDLTCRADARTTRWFSKGSTRLLDQIVALEDETESLLMELLVEGKVEFTVNDCGRGLNIRWLALPQVFRDADPTN